MSLESSVLDRDSSLVVDSDRSAMVEALSEERVSFLSVANKVLAIALIAGLDETLIDLSSGLELMGPRSMT